MFSVAGQAFALDGNNSNMGSGDIGIQWTNTTLVSVSLDFEGSKAICGAYVYGKSGVNKITATVTLSRKNSNGTYTTIKTWDNLYSDNHILIFDGAYYVSLGYTYRLTINATVYLNGIGETVSLYHEADT